MNHLDGTAGGTKVHGIKAVWDKAVFNQGFEPQIISGVSSSAVFSVPYALSIHDLEFRRRVNSFFDNFTLNTLFKIKPISKRNNLRLRAILRAIIGKSSLGRLRLDEVLRSFISLKDFVKYQSNDKYANCIVMSVDFKTGNKIVTSMKELSYEEFVLHCLASASVPIYSKPIAINDMTLFDGGVKSLSCAADVIRKYKPSYSLSVFSHPQKNSVQNNQWLPSGVSTVFKRMIEIIISDISTISQEEQKRAAMENDTTLYQVFLPNVLKSEFDTNRRRLDRLKIQADMLAPFAKKAI